VPVDVVDVDVSGLRPAAELVRVLVVTARVAEHDDPAFELELGVARLPVLPGHADLLGETERRRQELDRGVAVVVKQIRSDAWIAFRRILRHGYEGKVLTGIS